MPSLLHETRKNRANTTSKNIRKGATISSSFDSPDVSVSVSHADMEGMLSTIGVIAALVLSLQVGVFAMVPREDLLHGDYKSCLMQMQEFRTFVHTYLEKKEGFEMIVDLGLPDPFNMSHALLDLNPCDWWANDCYGHYFTNDMKKLDSVYHLTKNHFPFEEP